jgi:hypothetical protein
MRYLNLMIRMRIPGEGGNGAKKSPLKSGQEILEAM